MFQSKYEVPASPRFGLSGVHSRGSLLSGLLRLRDRCARKGRELLRGPTAPTLIRNLFQGDVWCGMTVDELRKSVGEPEAVERKVLGDRIQMTWKFLPRGPVHYALQVVIEGERVVSVEDRR